MKSLCLNRISKDLKEIAKSPLEGIGIVSLGNEAMKYIVNMKIMSGIFEGYCLQLLLTFPEEYPIKPPMILIYPRQYLDNTYHHHIFESNVTDEEGRYFKKFCFDLLQNDFLSTSEAHTGWNSSYTISTLLLQVQIFLSNPDFPNGYIPEKEKIDELIKSMDNYEKSFKIKNDKNEEIIKIHTWKNPYPEMYFQSNDNIKANEIVNNEDSKLKEIKENLTCFTSRLNYIDERNIILGYPIITKRKGNKLIPIPEILSYDCFIEESSKNYSFESDSASNLMNFPNIFLRNDSNNINEVILNNDNDNNINFIPLRLFPSRLIFEDYFGIFERRINDYLFQNDVLNHSLYKSASNEYYDNWLPIYINDEHFEKNKTTILNYFSIIKYGNIGLKKFDFHPQYMFEILPNLLSEMIIKMDESNISSTFLKCFFQYFLMFKKLERKYNQIFINYQKDYLNNKLKKVNDISENINIKKVIIELFILFLLCDNNTDKENKHQLENFFKNLKNYLYFPFFEAKNNLFVNKKKLKEDLKKKKLDVNIKNNIIGKLDKLLIERFGLKYFFYKDDLKINSIINEIFNTDLFVLIDELNITDKISTQELLLKNLNISEYLYIDNIINKITPGNHNFNISEESCKFISLFDFIKEKIFSKHFLDDLEKNYGVFLEAENFIKEYKTKFSSNLNILKKYELFFIEQFSMLNYLYENSPSIYYLDIIYYNRFLDGILFRIDNKPWKKKSKFNKIFQKVLEIVIINENKSRKKKTKIKFKEIMKRNKFNIKTSYNKINNNRLTKYITQKNINRLLLFKRNHY